MTHLGKDHRLARKGPDHDTKRYRSPSAASRPAHKEPCLSIPDGWGIASRNSHWPWTGPTATSRVGWRAVRSLLCRVLDDLCRAPAQAVGEGRDIIPGVGCAMVHDLRARLSHRCHCSDAVGTPTPEEPSPVIPHWHGECPHLGIQVQCKDSLQAGDVYSPQWFMAATGPALAKLYYVGGTTDPHV